MPKKPLKVIWICRHPERWGDGDDGPYYDTARRASLENCKHCLDRKGAIVPKGWPAGLNCPGPVKYGRCE